MQPAKGSTPGWATYCRQLCVAIANSQDDAARLALRGDLWRLLHLTLSRYLRYHSARLGRLDPSEIQDITSQKSLDLINRIDTSSGGLLKLEAPQIPGFVSTVARNGLVDSLKAANRWVSSEEGTDSPMDESRAEFVAKHDGPDTRVERNEFARALRECSKGLEIKARHAWFFRVFYEMPTKQIASHPKIDLKPAHVDVILQRGREAIRSCMKSSGYEPGDMPAGCFVELWKMFHRDDKDSVKEVV